MAPKRTFVVEEKGFPDLQQLMVMTLEALRRSGGSANIDELDEAVIEIEGVSEEEQAITMPNDGRPKIRYYLSWARTYLKRGGAIENSSRGVWALTEAGETIRSKKETGAIFDRVVEEEKERARRRRNAKKNEAIQREPTEESLEPSAEENGSTAWKTKLLTTLKVMEPSAFERLSQRLLREAGFGKVEVKGKTGDGGIDGVGFLRVNLVSFQVYFQCKRYKGSVGAKEIRDFRGALQGRANKGLFITTGTFTSQASDEATRDGAIAIDLIDGDRLCDLLKQFDLGVKTEIVEKVTVDPTWFSGF